MTRPCHGPAARASDTGMVRPKVRIRSIFHCVLFRMGTSLEASKPPDAVVVHRKPDLEDERHAVVRSGHAIEHLGRGKFVHRDVGEDGVDGRQPGPEKPQESLIAGRAWVKTKVSARGISPIRSASFRAAHLALSRASRAAGSRTWMIVRAVTRLARGSVNVTVGV